MHEQSSNSHSAGFAGVGASPPPKRFNRTDAGNAERFAHYHGASVRHVAAWKRWLVWDGVRWTPDALGDISQRAKWTARSILLEAAEAENKGQKQALITHANRSESRSRIEAMLALARSEPPIATTPEQLDNDAWLLNTQAGTINLRSGELRRHDRGDLITKSTNCDYLDGEGWEAPLWTEFLETIFAGDAELIGFVQRLIGVSLIGEQLEHVFPILWGSGANGKSVFTGAIQHALGNYAVTAAPGLFTVKRGETHPTELADLHGRRLAILHETQDGSRLNEGLIKSITGGDVVKARRMREDFWQFTPTHTAMLVTNHRPRVAGNDSGIWRRLRLVPFEVTIPPERQDRELATKLRQEAPAIVRWAVEGCLAWQRERLREPKVVIAATEGYREESDTFGKWLAECCVVKGCAEAGATQLLQSYNSWAETLHEREGSATWLGRKLVERGFSKVHTRQGVRYQGVGLRSTAT